MPTYGLLCMSLMPHVMEVQGWESSVGWGRRFNFSQKEEQSQHAAQLKKQK